MFPLRLLTTFEFVVGFTITMGISRGISIWVSRRLQNVTGLTIVECKTSTEMDEVERRLLDLRNVLLENKTFGRSFLNDHQVFSPGPGTCGANAERFVVALWVLISSASIVVVSIDFGFIVIGVEAAIILGFISGFLHLDVMEKVGGCWDPVMPSDGALAELEVSETR
jgi:hypothetical protein